MNPTFAVVWLHGFTSISFVMAAAKHADHRFRGNAAVTSLTVDVAISSGFRPTLSKYITLVCNCVYVRVNGQAG